jgi:hypothetical protein
MNTIKPMTELVALKQLCVRTTEAVATSKAFIPRPRAISFHSARPNAIDRRRANAMARIVAGHIHRHKLTAPIWHSDFMAAIPDATRRL